jgi:malonyl-CoA O-methyltransferase
MDKNILIRNFSRHAYTFDSHSDVQNRAARQLLGMLKNNNFSRILEIGCGTGNYTLLLREKFPGAKLKALDLSDKMIEVATKKLRDTRIEFMVQDAETVDLNEDFDLITSNACFQWFDNFDGTLIKYKDLLEDEGLILFSIFGPETFWELNKAFEGISKDASISVTKFNNREDIKESLGNHFKEVEIKEIRFKESFYCLWELLNKIKYTGIRGEGLCSKIKFNRKLLEMLEEVYLDKFGKVTATYQIFFCRGQR